MHQSSGWAGQCLTCPQELRKVEWGLGAPIGLCRGGLQSLGHPLCVQRWGGVSSTLKCHHLWKPPQTALLAALPAGVARSLCVPAAAPAVWPLVSVPPLVCRSVSPANWQDPKVRVGLLPPSIALSSQQDSPSLHHRRCCPGSLPSTGSLREAPRGPRHHRPIVGFPSATAADLGLRGPSPLSLGA